MAGVVARTAAVLLALLVIPQGGALVGGTFTYTVQTGDSLARIGARFGVAAATLARRNALLPGSVLHPGQQLELDNRHVVPLPRRDALVLNIAQRMLYFQSADGLHALPVAVGTPAWPTPQGRFTIVEREVDPAWDVPISIQEEMRQQHEPVITRMPPGPKNPLGRRFIRLSLVNIGIHGTIEPASIYRFASHGCIRLHADDIAWLYDRVAVGMTGIAIYEPVLMTVSEGRVFLEVHPDAYRQGGAPLARARALAEVLEVGKAVDWEAAADVVRHREGLAVDVTLAAE
jgi:L,D-transpeptidase ErfK/SrfK